MAGRPVQRVERAATIDPAGGVTRVERVGQRRQQVFDFACRFPDGLQRLAADLLDEQVACEMDHAAQDPAPVAPAVTASELTFRSRQR